MALSVQPWYRRGVAGAAEKWGRSVRRARVAGAALGERYLEVRYEQLIDTPDAELRRLCRFSRFPFAPEMLAYPELTPVHPARHFALSRQPPQAGTRPWREGLEHDDVAMIELIAGREMTRAGYEPVTTGARRRVRPSLPDRARARGRPDAPRATTRRPGAGRDMNCLSLVISARNAAGHLERCLASVAPQRSELQEVIVVDDGSVDGSAEVARAAGCDLIRFANGRGICAPSNAGARTAVGDVIIFIDADTKVQPGWARALRGAFDEGATLVGGGLRWPEPRTLAERYQFGGRWHDSPHRNGFLPLASGAHFAIRREVFLQLGGFDEVLPSAEDVDTLVPGPARRLSGLVRTRGGTRALAAEHDLGPVPAADASRPRPTCPATSTATFRSSAWTAAGRRRRASCLARCRELSWPARAETRTA